jgi:hypothetical protein
VVAKLVIVRLVRVWAELTGVTTRYALSIIVVVLEKPGLLITTADRAVLAKASPSNKAVRPARKEWCWEGRN